MYHTGKQYGLQVTSYVDERSDVLKATQAACEYLEYLHDRFEDWDLALAAYNSGPGNVSKAIRKANGKRNYWNIRQFLPKETRSYVPAFYATYYLFEYNNEHQIHPKNDHINFYQTDIISIKKHLSFEQIQKQLPINEKLLKQLNPQYKLNIIPGTKNKAYSLTLPKNLSNRFNPYETDNQSSEVKEQPEYIIPTKKNSHVVQRGENLKSIAKKHNISIQQLKKWNGLQTDYLIENQRLVVKTVTPIKEVDTSAKKLVKKSEYHYTYQVKQGESLWVISKKLNNVSVNQLRDWNNLWGVNYIEPGTKLKILTN